MNLQVIARIHTPFQDKFGIPRQSGLVQGCQSTIIFEEPYRVEEALRGIEQYSHLWLLFIFDRNHQTGWSPTVRPPRLGGNQRMGVFATRSPFRPNPIGLSSVRLLKVRRTAEDGLVLDVDGADLADGTPIVDIKPYLAYVDAHADARDGFAGEVREKALEVDFPEALLQLIPENQRQAVLGILAQDIRPGYHHDADRVYGFTYDHRNIRFTVQDACVHVLSVEEEKQSGSN